MKNIEINEQSIIIDRRKFNKVIKLLVFLIIGIAAALQINNIFSFNFYGSFFENAALFVLGLIITICGGSILFIFVEKTPKRAAICCAVISLALGIILGCNYYMAIGEYGTLPGFEDDLRASLILAAVFHFVYAVVVYALSMLVFFVKNKIVIKKRQIG